jgi:hypothetical protein
MLSDLEDDPCVFKRERLRERLAALDALDTEFGGIDAEALGMNSERHDRAQGLRKRLEAANAEVYESLRSDILHGTGSHTLHEWLRNPARKTEVGRPLPGFSFDYRDDLVSGILQIHEPREADLRRSPEMVSYQPTPVRHIVALAETGLLSDGDVLVDLGSGLGHVPLLVSVLTGVRSIGIEVEAGYVARARECAERLQLGRVNFFAEDARVTDVSRGTFFYLYSPFTGSILAKVLRMLREEGRRRPIRICSLGPCTATVAREDWLKATTTAEAGRIAVFESR